MFTGIIQEIGSIKDIKKNPDGLIMRIKSRQVVARLETGSSVAVNGICSTVLDKADNTFSVQYIKETLNSTTALKWQNGNKVNLEPSLHFGDEISGHMVAGHVDCTGTVTNFMNDKEKLLTIEVPSELMKFIAKKGSIAIDGVSLTVTKISKKTFSIALIRHTLRNTTLSTLLKGDTVNIEIDILARYAINAQNHESNKS